MKSISTLFRQLSLIVVLISAFSLSVWGEEVTITLNQGIYANSQITWTEDNFIVEQTKGNVTTAVNSNYISAPRVYKGHILSFTANSGYKITNISITYNSSYKGNSIVVGTSIQNNVVVANNNITSSISTNSNGTHTFTSKNGEECIHIQNLATQDNVQLRPTSIKVTIVKDNGSDPETPCTKPTISFAETTVTKTNGDDPFTNTLTTNSSGEVTYTSSATNVATFDNNNNGQVTIKGVGTTTITATVAADGTYCEATAKYTLTVEGRTFNITWMNGTEPPQTTTYKEGETLKFPTDPTPSTACQSAGWEFAGWSTTAIDSDTKTANLITNSYTPTKNTDLYAVYQLKTTTSEGEEAWALTNIANISATDEVVITMKKSDGKIYALTNDKGTSYPPTPTSITITNNKITSTIDDNIIKWNISNSNGNLTIYPNDTTATWLYCTNANNGVRVGNNTAKTFTIDGNYLKHTETSRYVGVYNTQDWRCYTDTTGNIANQTLGFYKKFGGTQTTITYNSNPDCETPIAQTPTFTPEEGKVADNKFTEPFSLTISSEQENATIYYSFDGEIFNKYTEPITISATTTIYAYAEAEGYNRSNTTEITYTFLKTYTVNWYNGELVLTEEYTENTALNLPEPQSSCSDVYTNFTGWTTNASGYKGVINSNEPQYVSNETIVTSNMDLYAVFNNATTTISLVTVASTLDVGDQIVIAAKDYNYALSTTQNGNNRGQAAITKVKNKISIGSDVQILTLEAGTKDGTFAFNTGSGYLYAASSSSNHLKTQATLSDNSSWTIEITDSVATIKAQGENTRNWMRYNSTNNPPIFSSYGSGQNDIVIYKVEGELASGWTICGEATDIIVENNQIVTIKNTANVNTLTIKSNLDEAGQVAVTSGSLTAQKVVVEKTIDSTRWFFFSLPFDCNIAEIEAIGADGNSLTYDKHYVISKYNQTRAEGKDKAWEELLGTELKLNANQGYIIGHWYKQSDSIIVKFHSTEAQRIVAPTNKTLNYTDTWFVDGENSSKGFNLIGMPYYQKINSTISCDSVYIYYSTTPNKDGKTYTQEEYTGNNVAPFTSFFVQVKAAPTFTISKTQSAAPMLRAKDVVAKATITLADANGGADETTVINNPTKTTDYEIGHDLVKWIGYAEIPQIYSIQGNDILAFNSLAMNNETIIPLGVYAHADGDYTFSLSDKSVGNLEGWELYDNETGKAVALTDESLTVTLSKGTHEGRFSIRMEQGTTTDCECDMSNIVTYMNNGTFYIENMPAEAMVYIYDAVGRMIYATETTDTSFDYTFALRGVYNVVVSTEYNSIAYKTIY